MGWLPSAARVYRTLLFAYPAEFRHEYGGQMEEFLLERLRAEPPLRVWRQALADVAVSAPREHWHVLAGDLRYAARLFRQAPAFTLVALLTAAMGIAASAAVFSLVNAVLLRSLPYGDPERLVYLWTPNVRFGPPVPLELGPQLPDFFAWQHESRSFSHLALILQDWFTVPGGNAAERIGGARVNGDFFTTMGTAPELGRTIAAEDDQPGHEQVVVISHTVWETQFAGDPEVVGKTLALNGRAHQVIGVMPPGFEFPRRNELPPDISNTVRTEVWVPAALTEKDKQSSRDCIAVGRLVAGVSLARAQQEMAAIEKRIDEAHKPGEQGWYALVKPLLETALGPARPQMWLLLGAVSLVLLISTGNVANLLLTRAAGRVHEMSLRTALGADRARLMRQAITESLLLAAGGCALGVLGAQAMVWVLVRLNPGDIPRLDEASLDARVLLFAVGISVIAGLVFGVAPAISASRNDPMSLLREGGHRGVAGVRRRARNGLIVAEVGLSMVLLAGAGLLIKSEWKLQSEGTGFAPSALTMRVVPPPGNDRAERRAQSYGALISAVRALPGVIAAGLGDLPFSHNESMALFEVEGYANRKDQLADCWRATPGYFKAMQIPLREGRLFEERDVMGATGAILANQAFVERYLAGRGALGRRVRLANLDGSGHWHTVVGVVGNVRHTKIDEAMRPAMYTPGWPWDAGFLAVRGVGGTRLAAAIPATAHRLDPGWQFSDIRTMDEAISKAGAARKFQMLLLTAFAGMALFLALVGLYGVIAFSVKQRTAEIGVRMALGASRGKVMGMVLRQGAGLALAGLVLGLAGALALTRLIAGWLYGVSPVDAATLATVAGLLFGVSLAASAIPAWRAARIDPVAALRD
ncbi:MAG TPA: ABC transporter permease [Bryobacteraceae bacterium]|nr:ABC transporter permease [Bryobacteraceae bacterium]